MRLYDKNENSCLISGSCSRFKYIMPNLFRHTTCKVADMNS
jgi:hypothetical protein